MATAPTLLRARRPRTVLEFVLAKALGNDAAIGGVRVMAANALIRGAAVGFRGHLQDPRRKFTRADHLQRILAVPATK
jgi:hypothetical protein